MKCHKCLAKLPRKANYCPNCGRSMRKITTPEEARVFHKEMRKYKDGPRLPLFMRYPDFPMQISIVALVAAILELIYAVATIL